MTSSQQMKLQLSTFSSTQMHQKPLKGRQGWPIPRMSYLLKKTKTITTSKTMFGIRLQEMRQSSLRFLIWKLIESSGHEEISGLTACWDWTIWKMSPGRVMSHAVSNLFNDVQSPTVKETHSPRRRCGGARHFNERRVCLERERREEMCTYILNWSNACLDNVNPANPPNILSLNGPFRWLETVDS